MCHSEIALKRVHTLGWWEGMATITGYLIHHSVHENGQFLV